VVRVAVDGSQTVQNTAKWDSATNSWVPAPIPAGSATDRLFLTLFATGLRHASTGSVTATVHGERVAVDYAGPQPAYLGVDQVNLELPSDLAGAGQVSVVISVNGEPANTVTIDFQ
jgi:uncharacterized protein (TIGR03437 family)